MNSPEFNSRTVDHFTPSHELTSVDNSSGQYIQACTALLKEYLPQVDFSQDEIEKLTGYKEGLSAWGTQHLLSLNDLGIETAWVENIDLDYFSLAPFEYMHTQFSDESAYRFQVGHSDLPLEARRAQEYLDRGLLFEEREATTDDVRQFLQGGWLVRLEVNGKRLADQPGYSAYSILVTGCNDDTVIFQNLDGASSQTSNQQASWDVLERAWQEFNDSKRLNAYRLLR